MSFSRLLVINAFLTGYFPIVMSLSESYHTSRTIHIHISLQISAYISFPYLFLPVITSEKIIRKSETNKINKKIKTTFSKIMEKQGAKKLYDGKMTRPVNGKDEPLFQ